jgi:hypothetical protein
MAISNTYTASLQNNNLKNVHAGVNVVHNLWTFTGTTTTTPSAMFLLAKVPDGATIVDIRFYAVDNGTSQTYDIGVLQPEGSTSGSVTFSQSALASALSISGNVVTRTVQGSSTIPKLPYKVSLSGEANPKFAWVTAVNSGAMSGTAIFSMTVFYTMDSNI